jgi:hypothetical protein
MLFKEVIAVYNENQMDLINTKYNVTNWKPGGTHIYRSALRG